MMLFSKRYKLPIWALPLAIAGLVALLGWWGNDNEMFIAVAAEDATGWVEDLSRYSFCLWDMEVMWHERNAFIDWMYGVVPSLDAYRADRLCKT